MAARWRWLVAFCVAVGWALGAAGGVAGQADPYDLAVTDSLELPERTVTLEGERFTVTAVAVRDPGATVAVEASLPANETGEVNLITAEKQLLASASVEGPATVDIDTTGVDPGTYLLVLVVDGDPVAIHPLVLRAYTLSIDAPSSARLNTTVEVTVTVERVAAPGNLSRVELVLSGEEDTFRGTVPEVADGTYRVDLPLRESLATGEYGLWALAEAEDILAFGRPVVLGSSERHPMTVEPARGPATFASPTRTPTPRSPATTADADVLTPVLESPETADGGFGVGSTWPWLVGGVLVAVGVGYWGLRRGSGEQ